MSRVFSCKNENKLDLEALGARIRRLRISAGYGERGCQGRFAKETGLSSQQLSDYEGGRQKPKLEWLFLVGKKFGADLTEILLGAEAPTKDLKAEEWHLIHLWRRLADADRAAFLTMLDRMAHKEEIIQSLGGPSPPKAARAGGG